VETNLTELELLKLKNYDSTIGMGQARIKNLEYERAILIQEVKRVNAEAQRYLATVLSSYNKTLDTCQLDLNRGVLVDLPVHEDNDKKETENGNHV